MGWPDHTLMGTPLASSRQRIVVLTFDSVEEAEAWDAAGQPIDLGLVEATVET